jgi:crotonobetainyl-CoA:carnitine CoA-transferase CaiB-like acyl-CoA transferase
MAALPLTGYRVLELAHLIAGPACGMYLADMGADVVKIEQPAGGDASRTVYGTQLGGESAVFVTVNRNKRSVTLDLARPEGRSAFERLVARADVVIEAYRGGVAERLGIDWPRLAPLNPKLGLLLALRVRPGRTVARQARGGHAGAGHGRADGRHR